MPALPPQVVVKIIHETLYVLLIIICDYLQGDKGMREVNGLPFASSLRIQTNIIT